jgi:hypothetical protein
MIYLVSRLKSKNEVGIIQYKKCKEPLVPIIEVKDANAELILEKVK